MRNKYIYKKTKEDWYDPEYPHEIVAPCYWYEWTLEELKTYDFTDRGGEIEQGFEFVDGIAEGESNFYFSKSADANFNMGDRNEYLTLQKVHWDHDGLHYKETAWITDDWEFEKDPEFKVPKRFIKVLKDWKKFKENK
nr:hypothetical protein [uncultured Mediterranean phage uvMED]